MQRICLPSANVPAHTITDANHTITDVISDIPGSAATNCWYSPDATSDPQREEANQMYPFFLGPMV
jgi:hypothetical protein